METTTPTRNSPPINPAASNQTVERLVRPRNGRVLAGVAAGIAERGGLSTGVVRIGFIIASFFGGFGVLAYLAAWALIPEEGTEVSAAERWLDRLTTPNRRLGAAAIVVAAVILSLSWASVTALAAVAILIGVALLASERRVPQPPSGQAIDAIDSELAPTADPT